MTRLAALLEHRIYALFLLTWIGLSLAIPGFLSESTSQLVLQNASIVGLMALGLTVTIIAGQLDLSIGANLALSGIVAIEAQRYLPAGAAAACGLVTGMLVGLLNGVLTTKARISSFIVTLGTMIAVRGVGYLITDSQPVAAKNVTFGIKVDQPLVWILTPRSLALMFVALALHGWLLHFGSGRRVFAVGGNVEAARLAGLAVDRCVIGAFVISGLASGLAGTLLALSLATGSPVVGQQNLITVFAAVIIGGTSLAGGRGSAFQTLAGVLILSGLMVGMDFKQVAFYYQAIVVGSLLVIVVVVDSLYESYRSRLATRNPARAARERQGAIGVTE